jgi:hypothetical protein
MGHMNIQEPQPNHMTIHKWGAVASFLIAVSFVGAPMIYLVGDLRDAIGVFGYDLADFLYGPILSASLITVIYVLRERIGERAFRRMDLALLAAVLAALCMAAVAFIRAANRHYHLIHPELNLENSTTVLVVWTTLVAGLNSLGFHFLGWAFVLLGSASWTAHIFPRLLSVFCLLAGVSAWFVYLFPELEGLVLLLGTSIGIWQGMGLWKPDPRQNTEKENYHEKSTCA